MSHNIHPAVRRQTIADALRRTAIRLPTKTGIVCGATTWTYAEFDALVSRLAAGLAHIGVAEGDKVAVLARNSHGFAALRFALARRSAVMVPINFMLKAEEVAYILRHAGAKTLATDSGLAELAQAASKLDTQVQQFIWLPSEDPASRQWACTVLMCWRLAPMFCQRFNWAVTTWRKSSTPAAPSRAPKAHSSHTTRSCGNTSAA